MQKKVKTQNLFFCFFIVVNLLWFCHFSLAASPYSLKSQLYFTSEGKLFFVLFIVPDHGWHFYGPELADDLGQPTVIRAVYKKHSLWVYYPPVQKLKNPFDKAKFIYGYKDKTPFFVKLPKDALGKTLELSLKGLFCSEKRCFPFKEKLIITLHHPKPIPLNWLAIFKNSKPYLFKSKPLPESSNSLETNEKQELPAFQIRFALPELEVQGLSKALFLGFLAGLILNLMPCVLPVVGLKLRSLQSCNAHDIKNFRLQNFLFVLGMLFYFVVLAGTIAWFKVSWGEIFQNVYFVLGILFLIYFLAFSMFGLCNIHIFNFGKPIKQQKLESFLSGFFITLLATPCSGPLLGGILAWTLFNSSFYTFLVFISVGFGLALPYILILFWPNLVSFIPKSGKWNVFLEKLVGFLLLATCIYLLSILPERYILKTLIVLLGLTFLLWIKRELNLSNPRTLYTFIVIVFVCLIISTKWITQIDTTTIEWHKYEQNKFINMLGKKNILIDFTASWCPTCKVLEKLTLEDKFLAKLQKKYDLSFVKVDLTTNNIAGKKLLRKLKSNSIPLLAIFPKNNPFKPIIFRDLFTQRLIQETLSKALD
ncbi:MAG: cytochrome c biogenesis protein CcdA [Desulfonauticus sp.]|nr:cytochrome c biogenesis protein CcdA [Desulfonauticus sp.]